jgi:hypothetical protein
MCRPLSAFVVNRSGKTRRETDTSDLISCWGSSFLFLSSSSHTPTHIRSSHATWFVFELRYILGNKQQQSLFDAGKRSRNRLVNNQEKDQFVVCVWDWPVLELCPVCVRSCNHNGIECTVFFFIIILLLTSQTDSYPFGGQFPIHRHSAGPTGAGSSLYPKNKKLDPELFAFVEGIDYAQSLSRFRLNDVT